MSEDAKKLFWFNVSGAIGTALFYGFYLLLVNVLPLDGPLLATVAWPLAYIASIVWQHTLHRVLVYGRNGPYWKSLAFTYVAYSASIGISSVIQGALAWAGLHDQLCFVLSTGITGVVNYFTLKNVFEPIPVAAKKA